MHCRSKRPPHHPLALILATWAIAWVLALGLTASPGLAITDITSPFDDKQSSSPKAGSNGGDPDGVGLQAPIPPGGGSPPLGPPLGVDEGYEGRALGPAAIRLWIMQVLIEIAI